MKLKDCKIGVLVVTEGLEVGHIVGLTHNIDITMIGSMSPEDRLNRVIPMIQFPKGSRGIHQGNIEIFRGNQ